MSRVRTLQCQRETVWWWALLITLTLVALPLTARAAKIALEESAADVEAMPVKQEAPAQKIVVAPEPDWQDWSDNDSRVRHSGGGPRIKLWIDRGEWSTYRPGDRLWVHYRVDRPCYVTVIDYSPDGRVDMLFPGGWSGSNFARPGRTYRIPESRRWSLRIAGSGGVETLVAYAHEVPWPSGPNGLWVPPEWTHPTAWRERPGHAQGDNVFVGGARPQSGPAGGIIVGSSGRVVVGSPTDVHAPWEWRDRPDRWGSDSVSFYVEEHGPRQRRHSDIIIHEQFKMRSPDDVFYRELDLRPSAAVLSIECVEHYKKDPTEIIGRLSSRGGWASDLLFHLDAEGIHGERPVRGRTYVLRDRALTIEIEILEFEIKKATRKRPARIDKIRFDVRVHGR